ncbi:nitrogenase iron-molybdenum cofactor biosynthesis protein NifN [Echinimonas agarilytica]|uniref:Nitrogenase iron-molybdenum cofactor biosynthesis protein NifN n=1 Tax=Echinimonas agarilytica TaxID=1215918 RepID=A0AA41W7X4_9GAMM|nr:nitrogenase iron-molybdenum cofactor biosynthesis protein NifN [Echinimonas agarilytica]MCM2680446.1 nitrogenase iron-molybdenum cofactor biosynthesis protein NifN [Echinimonas agarilytica]
MTTIIKTNRALAERPIKTSQATGAALAAMGLADCIPLMHGSQGCGAFSKVYLIQHFREPMPFQNTAVDHISAVMGSDKNVIEALALLCQKHQPALITLMTTGLTELQGCDIRLNIKEFREAFPEFSNIDVIAVNTPDFIGSMQSGFAAVVDSLLKQILPPATSIKQVSNRITVLGTSAMTPADVALIKDYVAAFELEVIFVPDLSLSLDGHLAVESFSPTSTGGASTQAIRTIPSSKACLSVGQSMFGSANWLADQFGIEHIHFEHLIGMDATDELLLQLSRLSGKPVPERLGRQRMRLQDCLLDVHFSLSGCSMAIAAESDLVAGFAAICKEVGISILLAVSPSIAKASELEAVEKWLQGDLSDLDAVMNNIELLIGNTHCAQFYEHLVPVLRAGFPCHDRFGNSDRLFCGYEGARTILFEMANLVMSNHKPEVASFKSPYREYKESQSLEQQ